MLETTWFYAPPSAFRGEWVNLPEAESHHVSNVLRGGKGEEIVVVDGEAGWYRVRLQNVDDGRAVGRIVEERKNVGEPPYNLTIGIGLIKRRRRFETFLEKAVELGVSRIIPLSSDHSEKETIREDRITRVLVAAMKQTRRSRLPVVEDVVPLDDLLGAPHEGLGILCHGQQEDISPFMTTIHDAPSRSNITVLVGPEGGFSRREVVEARQYGWKIASLGPRRLRTETAGIAVAAVVQMVLRI